MQPPRLRRHSAAFIADSHPIIQTGDPERTMQDRLHAQEVVFVIDDDPSLRTSLSSLFRSIGIKIVTFDSAADFLKIELPDAASCLVLDVRLSGLSGLDFQAELAKANVRIPIVFITGHGDIPMSVKAMKAGAVEFLTKPFREQDLLDAVRLGLERDRTRRAGEAIKTELRSRCERLTSREQEVMAFVTSGLMNKQIAGDLGVSEITVKVHRGNVMRKMGAKSLADLVRMADALGIRRETASARSNFTLVAPKEGSRRMVLSRSN
jgi:FixJ family two-component response regulator